MLNLSGKKFLIVGVANERSIAWGIAQQLHQAGATLAFTYLNEALEKRVRPLAESVGSEAILKLDAQSDEELDAVFADLKNRWGSLDGILHSMAFANKEDLSNPFSQTTRDGFRLAMDVSAYSLIALSRRGMELMKGTGGSILTLSYLGANKVVTNYNVMGAAKAALEASVRYLAAELGQYNIRVNAISAGPIKTLAAAGIPQFRELLSAFSEKAPLKRNVTQEDVGRAALFLLSELGSGVSGEITNVDCGYNIVGF